MSKRISKRMLITGGAGFIGSNAALYFGKRGWDIYILDDLSRRGSEANLESLGREMKVVFFKGDIRSPQDVRSAFEGVPGGPAAVLHLAAQVAVTTSVLDPVTDFDVNARGTVNVLETLRAQAPGSTLIYSSTNKVYGDLERRQVALVADRYGFVDGCSGIGEDEPLDFHSPYGCSKGAADQYVRDYGRIYGLRTFVVRQSCIYGTRQYGVEDQGWVAWFAIAFALKRNITVYGDGKQVRDLLWVEDLLDLYNLCLDGGKAGRIYNAGGGAENSVSILELLGILESRLGQKIPFSFSDWRPGDQKLFTSDNSRAFKELGWKPTTSVTDGLEKLITWIEQNTEAIKSCLGYPPELRLGTAASR